MFSLTVGHQGGITIKLAVKSCRREEAPITAPTPGGTSHQGNKLNTMAHIMVGTPGKVKLKGSASDPELDSGVVNCQTLSLLNFDGYELEFPGL